MQRPTSATLNAFGRLLVWCAAITALQCATSVRAEIAPIIISQATTREMIEIDRYNQQQMEDEAERQRQLLEQRKRRQQEEAEAAARAPNDTYQKLIRRPDFYIRQTFSMRGKIVQATKIGSDYTLRVNVTQRPSTWEDAVWVDYHLNISNQKFVEGDIIEFAGKFAGIRSDQSVSGSTIQIPRIVACKINVIPSLAIRSVPHPC